MGARLLTTFFILALLVSACNGQKKQVEKAAADPVTAAAGVSASRKGCQGCHRLEMDSEHDLACTTCHRGRDNLADHEESHHGLDAHPAHPARMAGTCGRCHHQVQTAATSLHFTLKNEVNLVRRHFGAKNDIPGLTAISLPDPPRDILGLADDMLRRRCLRCHLYYEGDAYPATRHATGCGACHLGYRNGEMVSHRFIARPGDDRCLACHYGNRVGGDYYGMFEHDYKWEFRTPYQPNGDYAPRPYGVEQHRLAPDVHRLAGLACVDCHSGRELMGSGHGHGNGRTEHITCRACHRWRPGSPPPLPNMKADDGRLFISPANGRGPIAVPQMRNPAHRDYPASRVDCAVCHARWAFVDWGTHLIRIDGEELDDWTEFVVQSSFEAEWQLNRTLHNGDDGPTFMADKITGVLRPGIWLKGFERRRWLPVPVGRSHDGRLRVMRPLLDLHLSYVDANGNVILDSATAGAARVWLPYTPHTIGPAAVFFRRRLSENLANFGNVTH